ncbi:MAG: hypothetical protein A2X94_00580 [Bdellovibrionales bacterium GWB1_55_8]|nr:MAG: hypothetical protein A2X94_00580 [Bdellovibrionales bacterium GWB1_55_8]
MAIHAVACSRMGRGWSSLLVTAYTGSLKAFVVESCPDGAVHLKQGAALLAATEGKGEQYRC